LDPLRADGRPERWLGLSAQQGFALAGLALGLTFLLGRAAGFEGRARRLSAAFGPSRRG
jgi:hypothetical protein